MIRISYTPKGKGKNNDFKLERFTNFYKGNMAILASYKTCKINNLKV